MGEEMVSRQGHEHWKGSKVSQAEYTIETKA